MPAVFETLGGQGLVLRKLMREAASARARSAWGAGAEREVHIVVADASADMSCMLQQWNAWIVLKAHRAATTYASRHPEFRLAQRPEVRVIAEVLREYSRIPFRRA